MCWDILKRKSFMPPLVGSEMA
ncbi:unnamed protein product [Clonostachys rhizophaga]|uniref:Uncharacterized protein n=1 Tax=Clonostachys rhizophaga TaxID=160324 RepID=A0A9N9YEH3_9HYPO|nr:unnamed protein product [Clonostachys rhizophaga]